MGLVILAYAIALLAGELLRDTLWGQVCLKIGTPGVVRKHPNEPGTNFPDYLCSCVALPASLRRRWRRLLARFPQFLLQAPVQTFV